ncbi:hypothetical protein [Hyphomicrobium sp. ghe19]|uniref:hypothetical protein n=1 Tax=Hyphomicrobium sp. ghe19 TaxID=2682968 RepID=UPI0030CD1B80
MPLRAVPVLFELFCGPELKVFDLAAAVELIEEGELSPGTPICLLIDLGRLVSGSAKLFASWGKRVFH